MRNIFSFFFLSLSLHLFSQATFQKTIGGTQDDMAWCIRQTFDQGYIMGGMSMSFGAGYDDMYLVKLDPAGNVLWTKTYGGALLDDGHYVEQTSDSGYVFVGSTSSFGAGGDDIYLLKTDPSGNLLWSKTFGGPLADDSYCVHQTSDGGYIVSGFTANFGAGNNDVYLIKTDPAGNVTWTKTYGGVNDDKGYSVQQTADGGYIISGGTDTFGAGGNDVYLIKTDVAGDTLWTRTFGGNQYETSYSGESIQQTSDHGFIISGETYSFGAGDVDVYLMKTDSMGNLAWSRTYGGSSYDQSHSVKQTSDGGYLIAGTSGSFGFGQWDSYVLKTNATGGLIWAKAFGSASREEAASLSETSSGGLILTGLTTAYGMGNVDIYVIKTDAGFNTTCHTMLISPSVGLPATQSFWPPTMMSSGYTTTDPSTIVGNGGVAR